MGVQRRDSALNPRRNTLRQGLSRACVLCAARCRIHTSLQCLDSILEAADISFGSKAGICTHGSTRFTAHRTAAEILG